MKKIHEFDEVFDAQKMFRCILTAMSNPGKRVDISEFSEKMYGASPSFLAVAMTLLDNEVTFCTCGDESLAGEIVSLTLASREELSHSDFIFVSSPLLLREAIESAKCGTLRDPQKSATVIVNIDDSESVPLRLFGPGIKNILELRTSDIVQSALALRDQQFYEYPQGVDFIFVSAGMELFALPRLTRWEV